MKPARRTLPPGFRHAARLVAIGASAGGVEALLSLLPALPASNVPAVVTVLHLPEDRDSVLAEILATRCAVPVREATDKAPVEPGVVYIAPAGYHLLVEPDFTFALSCDAPLRFSRPSIDVLFESAADAAGAGLAAILLTGANDDGARGLQACGEAGALTVVQDPSQAAVRDMPLAAIARREPSYILSLGEIRRLMLSLVPA